MDMKDLNYKNEMLIGQKKWYTDYMNKNIKTNNGNIGLPEEIYNLKPAKASNFQNGTYKIEAFKQPENIIEEIREIIGHIFDKF